MANIFGANGGPSGSILGGGSAVSMLETARVSYKGIGLSARARALSESYLSQSQSGLNSILGSSIALNGTTAVLLQKIKAIRASLPASQISPDLGGGLDSGNVSASTNGTNVNTTA